MKITMKMIDLRSDTVSQPTPAMREAMANAEVGDDVFGDDPTVNELQAVAAEMFGKEAALFVASGTMGNLISVLSHCGRGDEMILGRQAHIFRYEAGGAAAYGGVHPNPLEVSDAGRLDLNQIKEAIRPINDPHTPRTRLICLENTQGFRYGVAVPKSYFSEVAQIARENNLAFHLDGARIFNASTALGTTVKDLCEDVDSISVCLSKGLVAPVGSLIVGSREFIAKAHRIRKSLGGGMRQAGILAAAGLISLREMTLRLDEDHANARMLAEGLARIAYVEIDLNKVHTNMVYFSLTEDSPLGLQELSDKLRKEYAILMRPYNMKERMFRLVTHYWITPEHVTLIINAVRQSLGLSEEVPAAP